MQGEVRELEQEIGSQDSTESAQTVAEEKFGRYFEHTSTNQKVSFDGTISVKRNGTVEITEGSAAYDKVIFSSSHSQSTDKNGYGVIWNKPSRNKENSEELAKKAARNNILASEISADRISNDQNSFLKPTYLQMYTVTDKSKNSATFAIDKNDSLIQSVVDSQVADKNGNRILGFYFTPIVVPRTNCKEANCN